MILQDVRYALRGLWHRPAFTAIAIADARARHRRQRGGLQRRARRAAPAAAVSRAAIGSSRSGRPTRRGTGRTRPSRRPIFSTGRARSRSFDGIAYYIGSDSKGPGLTDATLTGAGEPDRVRGMEVSANFFAVLGAERRARPHVSPAEEQRGHAPRLVLSDGFWRRRFAADPAIVGRTIELDGAPVQVIGVMPRDVQLSWRRRPTTGRRMSTTSRSSAACAGRTGSASVARLAPGVTLDQAARRHDAHRRRARARVSGHEHADGRWPRAAARVVRRRQPAARCSC